jgi:Ni,Fe-hydrogenase III small subunit
MAAEMSGAIRTAAIANLGCKVNQAEMEGAARRLRERGIAVVDLDRPADLVLVNTCTVTAEADAKSRHAVRQARRLHPAARMVVTGCSVQVDRSAFATADPGARLVDKAIPIYVAGLQSTDQNPRGPVRSVGHPGMGSRNDVFEGCIIGDLYPQCRTVSAIRIRSASPENYAGGVRIGRCNTVRIEIATLRPALPRGHSYGTCPRGRCAHRSSGEHEGTATDRSC